MLPSFVDVEVTTNELGRFRHPLEHGEGPGLVERFVQVPALGALHAGRAAEQTRAAAEQLSRVRDPALECLEAALRDPDTARVAVEMKTVGAPVWKCTFVERPPISHRSHIAQSGSSAIS